jgi:hypothetical protein
VSIGLADVIAQKKVTHVRQDRRWVAWLGSGNRQQHDEDPQAADQVTNQPTRLAPAVFAVLLKQVSAGTDSVVEMPEQAGASLVRGLGHGQLFDLAGR